MTTTTAPAARHRTRKTVFSDLWNVQVQEIKGLWHTAGVVRAEVNGQWSARHHGRPLGYYPTKRAAVQAVVDAEAGVGS